MFSSFVAYLLLLAFTCPHTPLPLTKYSLTESVYRSFKGAGSYGAVNLKHECSRYEEWSFLINKVMKGFVWKRIAGAVDEFPAFFQRSITLQFFGGLHAQLILPETANSENIKRFKSFVQITLNLTSTEPHPPNIFPASLFFACLMHSHPRDLSLQGTGYRGFWFLGCYQYWKCH